VVFHELTDLLLEYDEVKTTLVRCQDCGLVYQNPRPTLDEIGVHYPAEYESYNPETDNKSMPRLLRKAVEYGINKRCRFVIRQKKQGRLLDIGCATGTFLRGMAKYPGWELNGVEISEHAAKIAREAYSLNVFNGTLEEAAYPEHYFDAITLWDVLEHLHDPSSSLDEIHRILKPDGVIVFRIPNLGSWDAKLFGPYWAGLDAPRHLYVFDQHTLNALLTKTGFEVREMSCKIGSYPTFVLSVRFWMAAKGISPAKRASIQKILSHPISRLLSAPFFYVNSMGRHGPLLTVTAAKRS
jgi:2-polyprenyl-3-methyl-5-hydroxy-6-metoxy-1,4-benzoquinol methylase